MMVVVVVVVVVMVVVMVVTFMMMLVIRATVLAISSADCGSQVLPTGCSRGGEVLKALVRWAVRTGSLDG